MRDEGHCNRMGVTDGCQDMFIYKIRFAVWNDGTTRRHRGRTSAAFQIREPRTLRDCNISSWGKSRRAVEDQFACMHGMEVLKIWLRTGLAVNIVGGSEGGTRRNADQPLRQTPTSKSLQRCDCSARSLFRDRSLLGHSKTPIIKKDYKFLDGNGA